MASDTADKNGNIFRDTLQEITKEAPEELVDTLRSQMTKMRDKFIHTKHAVDQCLPILDKKPTVHDILVICYILNGGLLLKHDTESEDYDEDAFLKTLENTIFD